LTSHSLSRGYRNRQTDRHGIQGIQGIQATGVLIVTTEQCCLPLQGREGERTARVGGGERVGERERDRGAESGKDRKESVVVSP
jgi:hypothetical protein